MYRRSGLSFFHQTLDSYVLSSPILIQKSRSMWVPKKQKSSGGWRPKKKIYHRDHELDRAIDLQKKPSLILQLKSIIQSQKHQSLFLRDLEKQVGFVQKWNFISIIEKYPTIFHVGGGSDRSPPFVTLTEKAKKISNEEPEARALMEPILVKNLRKLLMMSVDCRIPLEKIECIDSELGLPQDFKKTLIPKYPEFFSVKEFNGKTYLYLENWDSSLAFTAREERLARKGILNSSGAQKKVRITKDGLVMLKKIYEQNLIMGLLFLALMKYEVTLTYFLNLESPIVNSCINQDSLEF